MFDLGSNLMANMTVTVVYQVADIDEAIFFFMTVGASHFGYTYTHND